MKPDTEAVKTLPIRTRVSFLLTVCERLLSTIHSNQDAFSAARAAIDDGWKWTEGSAMSARQLYNHLEHLVELETSATHERAIDTICAIELTVQYSSWHAFRVELKGVTHQSRPVPNDMADVTEDVINQVVDLAIKADSALADWITKLLAEYRSKPVRIASDELGAPVSTREFGL